MKKKKATMQDIADLCGVSVATVSYVINNSESEHIRHDTRIRVLETAKRLNYIPNQNHCRQRRQKSNLIGIIINWDKTTSYGRKMQSYDLAIELQQQLSILRYDTIIATTRNLEEKADILAKRSLDAAFIIDIRTQEVRQLTRNYYVPILFLDCEINDPLFCKIYPNYDVIISTAHRMLLEKNLFLIMDDMLNEECKDLITSKFDADRIFLCRSGAACDNQLREFLLKHQNEKGIVFGEILGLEVERYISNDNIVVVTCLNHSGLLLTDTKTISVKNRTRAETAVRMLQQILSLSYINTPFNQVLLNPDSSKC